MSSNMSSNDSDNHNGSPILVKAQFAYDPVEADEMALHEGDTVQVLDSTDPGGDWLFGLNLRSNAKGHFPSNYIIHIETPNQQPPPPRQPPPPAALPPPPPANLPPPVPSIQESAPAPAQAQATATGSTSTEQHKEHQQQQQSRLARVEYDYAAQKSGELNLTAGDKITVTAMGSDIGIHGWCRGENANGQVGIFPENHIRFMSDAQEDKQRKLAAYGVRIGMAGAVPMFPMGLPGAGGLPALKKAQLGGGSASTSASPTSSNPALHAASSTTAGDSHPALPRRPAPPSIPAGAAAPAATPAPAAPTIVAPALPAALGHNRVPSIPKLPAGIAAATRASSPPSHPPPTHPPATEAAAARTGSTDSATSTARSNSVSSSSSGHHDHAAAPAQPTLPSVSTDPAPVSATESAASTPTSPPPALSSLTKARPAQAKRPPSNVRTLAHTQATPVTTPTSAEPVEAPQHAPIQVQAPPSAAAAAPANPVAQSPPALPAKPVRMPSSSPERPKVSTVPTATTMADPAPIAEPTRTSSTSSEPQQQATTPTTASARFGRVSSAIANLQANLGISGSGGASGAGTAPARATPPLPGAKPLFGSLVRRQQSTGNEPAPAPAPAAAVPAASTVGGPPSPTRSSALPPLSVASTSSPTSSVAATTGGSTIRDRSRSPSPTRSMTAAAPLSPTRALESNGTAAPAHAGDDSDVPSVQTLWDMVAALKIEVAGLRIMVSEERAARVSVEKRLAEVEEVVGKLTSV